MAKDDRSAGFLILVGAALGAAAGFVGRRRGGYRPQSETDIRPEAEREAVSTADRPLPTAASPSATGSVAVASRPRTDGATLIETLSPRARLADPLYAEGIETDHATHEVCEIACWRGYVTWQFYVESESPNEARLVSPYFRAPGKGVPEQTDVALNAHAVLVEKLVTAGWEPEGYGEEWFSERFQRPSA